ncbi:Signal transduction histidine kinase [Faunimonas pinastri]|uniref:histidine kinase n=1 Tax=Faunimonas pinastri TaxID=1855383 RepID=A0A1H9GJU4_9HYPH|nr:PAS domain-containing sensor histidine kinase [Faunimonas pinastri]SEQ50357.1 Signal transduction histidine kinase [Faunimonas pinastri]
MGSRGHRRGAATIGSLLCTAAIATPASAAPLAGSGSAFGTVLAFSVCSGSVLVAAASLYLLGRSRRDNRLGSAQAEIADLRSQVDRAEALLAADDQKTIVWDGASASADVLGSLPEHVGAPFARSEFLAISRWLQPESAQSLEEAVSRLRRGGEGFQMPVRTAADALLEVTGRTSGKRSLVRFRELSGERRSLAELKEQAGYVANEMVALRTLADALPFPLWRRNRTGRLTWVNRAYVAATEAANVDAVLSMGIELLPARARDAVREAHRAGRNYDGSAGAIVAGERRRLQVSDILIDDGSVGGAVDVSEIDVVRTELKRVTESNAKTLDLLTASVAIFNREQKLLFFNEAYRRLWGIAPAFLSGNPDEASILDHLRADRKLPEQANYREWRKRHLDGYRTVETREEWWYLPDGRSLRMVAVPNAEGGLTYIFENVTEQLSLESRVNALSQLQGETLDHLTEAVAVFGTDGRLRLFNPVFVNIWRLSPAKLREEPHINDIIGECSAIYKDAGTWDAVRNAVTNLDHAETISGRMHRPDESVIDFATVALPEGMTMVTFVDVSDSARMQRALSERNEALEAADRLKTDFIQHVSYELRSPLTSIIGFAEMLSDETIGGLNPQQREYMDHIASSSSALLAIINDILDLATVDAGIMALDIREADIRAVAEAAVEGLRDRLAEGRLTLDITIPAGIGTFHVDEQRVRQILFNVVSNAIRFSREGGRIEVAGEKRGGWVTYTVRDDGMGIAPDMLPSVFEPFEGRASGGRRRGPGLGLSIVKSLVELHGGAVDIQSHEGTGTVVTVRLPVLPSAAAAAAE